MGLQILGVVMAIVGFILGYAFIGSRTYIGHLAVGSIILAMAVLQILTPICKPDKKADSRFYWNIVHHWNARLLFVLTIANVFVGLVTYGASNVALGLIAGWYAILAVIALALEVLTPKPEEAQAKPV